MLQLGILKPRGIVGFWSLLGQWWRTCRPQASWKASCYTPRSRKSLPSFHEMHRVSGPHTVNLWLWLLAEVFVNMAPLCIAMTMHHLHCRGSCNCLGGSAAAAALRGWWKGYSRLKSSHDLTLQCLGRRHRWGKPGQPGSHEGAGQAQEGAQQGCSGSGQRS